MFRKLLCLREPYRGAVVVGAALLTVLGIVLIIVSILDALLPAVLTR